MSNHRLNNSHVQPVSGLTSVGHDRSCQRQTPKFFQLRFICKTVALLSSVIKSFIDSSKKKSEIGKILSHYTFKSVWLEHAFLLHTFLVMANSRTPSPETTRPSSPLSWPPSREGSPTNDSNKLTTSPLYLSLLASVSSAGAVTKEAVGEKNIPMENNPRPLLTQMGDKAEYWVNGSGDLLRLKFPVRLDFHGHYSHLGPYFNLPDSGVSVY
jgi:hypothetical protein